MTYRALLVSFALSTALAGCSDGDELVSEREAGLTEEAHLEQQADSLEEAADKAMQIEIEAMEGDQSQAAQAAVPQPEE